MLIKGYNEGNEISKTKKVQEQHSISESHAKMARLLARISREVGMKVWNPEITMEQFEDNYCQGSGITKQYYREHRVTLPCNCEYEGCQGWASIRNVWDGIQHQLIFCLPSKEDMMAYSTENLK